MSDRIVTERGTIIWISNGLLFGGIHGPYMVKYEGTIMFKYDGYRIFELVLIG